MIKDIRKIDLQGNEYYVESVICNRCKRVLRPEDFYHSIKRVGWRPVRIPPNKAYGLGHMEPWHICDECIEKVIDVMEGKDIPKDSEPTLAFGTPYYESMTTEELIKIRSSFICSTLLADEIDKILKERGAKI